MSKFGVVQAFHTIAWCSGVLMPLPLGAELPLHFGMHMQHLQQRRALGVDLECNARQVSLQLEKGITAVVSVIAIVCCGARNSQHDRSNCVYVLFDQTLIRHAMLQSICLLVSRCYRPGCQ